MPNYDNDNDQVTKYGSQLKEDSSDSVSKVATEDELAGGGEE